MNESDDDNDVIEDKPVKKIEFNDKNARLNQIKNK